MNDHESLDIREPARRFFDEVLNGRRLDLLPEVAVDGYLDHRPLPGQALGIAGLRMRLTTILTSLDPHWTVEDVLADGDRVMVRWTLRGVQRGPFAGIGKATNRPFTITGIDLYRVRGGRLAEHWGEVDRLGLVQQVG
jgi:predicted ester cyclase